MKNEKYVQDSYNNKNSNIMPIIGLVVFVFIASLILFEKDSNKYSTLQANQAGISNKEAEKQHNFLVKESKGLASVSESDAVGFVTTPVKNVKILDEPNSFEKELVKTKQKKLFKTSLKRSKSKKTDRDSKETAANISKNKMYSFFNIVDSLGVVQTSSTGNFTPEINHTYVATAIESDSVLTETKFQKTLRLQLQKNVLDSLSYVKKNSKESVTIEPQKKENVVVNIDDIKNPQKIDTIFYETTTERPISVDEDSLVYVNLENDIYEEQEKNEANEAKIIMDNNADNRFVVEFSGKITDGRSDKRGNSTTYSGDAYKIVLPELSDNEWIKVEIVAQKELTFVFYDSDGNDIKDGKFFTKKEKGLLQNKWSSIRLVVTEENENAYESIGYKIRISIIKKNINSGNSPPQTKETKTLI